jgi:pimeloyl-ACP methyl ester carboxylesterase
LKELTLPVVIISGEADRIVPTADSARLANELPDARLIIIPRAGHVPHEEQPGQFLQALDDFIANQ